MFVSGDLELEGVLEVNSAERGVVISHPHPLYGGEMDNPVVEEIRDVYREEGYTTLRFNFRGVGRSGGRFGGGIAERDDVRAAVAFLQKRGISRIELAGYSFGAYVNAGVAETGVEAAGMIMVSPPVTDPKFGKMRLPALKLVVTGSHDEIAPPALVAELLPHWNPEARLEIIEGADHFYSRSLKKLGAVLRSFLTMKTTS